MRRRVDRSDPAAVQDARDDARAERMTLRRGMRRILRTDRLRACGLSGGRPDRAVVARLTEATTRPDGSYSGRVAGVAGTIRCGNVWCCAECAQQVAAVRAQRLERALAAAVEQGGWAVLITMTLRHHQRHPLAALLVGLRKGWRAVRSGREAQEERERLGVLGIVRSIEVTAGENGWHPHVHALVVFAQRPSRDALDAMAGAMFGRWTRAIVRTGLPAPLAELGGLDVSHLGSSGPVEQARSLAAWSRYAVKGLTGETVLGVVKDAKGSNRSVRELMRAAVVPTVWTSDDGRSATTLDETAADLLREYERATKAVKHLTGLAELEAVLGLDADERSDEEVVSEEVGGEDVAVIAGPYWDEVVEPLAAGFLAAGERYGADGMRGWLDRHGVPWTVPVPGTGRWPDQRDDGGRGSVAPGRRGVA